MCEKRISSLWGWIILVVIVVLAGSVTASGKVIYVDGDASFGGNGQNWATSYRYLQDALAVAVSGDEIKVAEGIYKPDRGGGNTPGNRYATFQLKNGVVITGGYAGFGEPQPDAWDIDVYETLLSGDLLGNDGPDFANNGENSYHVVTGSGTNVTAVLDGLTITGGNAYVGSDIPAGIISHWKFDEDQGSIAYDSAGNNHGIAYGAQWTTGQVDGALYFDGSNDYVMIPNESYFDITNRITLALWLRVNSFDRGWQAIITKGDMAWRMQRSTESNVIEFALRWIAPGGGYGNIIGLGNVNDGRWHHICGTYDGARIRLYMDGKH
jgi:hypothetical protein